MTQFDDDVRAELQGHPLRRIRFQYRYWDTRLRKYVCDFKNIAIHIIDMIHHYVFRHVPPQIKLGRRGWYLFCACDTLAESDWWTCNHKDWYCRRFEDWEEFLEPKGGKS